MPTIKPCLSHSNGKQTVPQRTLQAETLKQVKDIPWSGKRQPCDNKAIMVTVQNNFLRIHSSFVARNETTECAMPKVK